jgi:lipopolysaccharide/colanic/teichoic acid biosynthesis glycosyltransferase
LGLMKRAFDVIVGGIALVVLSPLLTISALWVWLDDGRPVVFRQDRAGVGGRPFRILKLRTLKAHDLTDEEIGQITGDNPLLTSSGRILRRLKLDEVLQLTNVVKGDMSLVGPRPTLPEQTEAYGPFERRRLTVRPGLTGWAQINGNTKLTWEERILLDVWYVDNWSPSLDLKILLRTASVVAGGEKVNILALKEAAAHADRVGRGG